MNKTHLLGLLTLFVGWAESFTWDIVVGENKRLVFYSNGTITYTKEIPSVTYIASITYDPDNDRLLFADIKPEKDTIYIFHITNMTIQRLVMNEPKSYRRVAYDPVTDLLIWKEDRHIYSFSLDRPGKRNVIVTQKNFCKDIAVESKGGYIYWITDKNIERARFDGSEREVLINSTVFKRLSLAIDQPEQKMYWIQEISNKNNTQVSIETADLKGKNQETLHIFNNKGNVNSWAVAKDFIYWMSIDQKEIWRLPKGKNVAEKPFLFSSTNESCTFCQVIAANYPIKKQTQGSCEVDLCYNYCFLGTCKRSADGSPSCSCNAGHMGLRCEINTCYNYCLNNGECKLIKNKAVCQCKGGYEGERCDIAVTGAYCDNKKNLQDVLQSLKTDIEEKLQRAMQPCPAINDESL